ncbi:MAG TPA: hypothetical protein VL307_20035 [Chitinophagaceae bacterium]|nr:hypothetical protein [Chitinophagaceae bacterium]
MKYPRNTCLLLVLPALLLLSSCVQKAYYQHPAQTIASNYHAMPLASDSVAAASYVDAGISLGGMNYQLRDNVFSLQAGVHRAHVLQQFRLLYGGAIALGGYHVKPYDYYANDSYYLDTAAINRSSGTRYWGNYGLYLAASAATRLGRRGEWRYIGVEGSFNNEFGSYATYRKGLPDSAATIIDRQRVLGSAGISTEFIFKGRSGKSFGIKLAAGSLLRNLRYYNKTYANPYHTYDHLLYFSNSYHLTVDRTTAYMQLNVATHGAGVQFGVNYKLSR